MIIDPSTPTKASGSSSRKRRASSTSPPSSPPSTKKSSTFKDSLTSTVTVTTRGTTNNDAKELTLHLPLLDQKCPHLASLARAAENKELKLLQLDSSAFAIFAAWLYGSGIEFDCGEVGAGSKPTATDADLGEEVDEGDILASVLECYTLALQLEAPAFANEVLSRACDVSMNKGLVFLNEVINAIYRRTAAKEGEGGLLRRWMVDEWVWQFDAEGVGALKWVESKILAREFLFGVVRAQAGRLGDGAKKHRAPGSRVQQYFYKDE